MIEHKCVIEQGVRVSFAIDNGLCPRRYFGGGASYTKYLTLAIWLICLLCTTAAQATDSQSVYWAGFAFTGDSVSRASVAPYSALTIKNKGVEALNQSLSVALRKRPPAHLQIISDQLAKLDGSTSATVLAAALDRETTSVEPIGGKYKLCLLYTSRCV